MQLQAGARVLCGVGEMASAGSSGQAAADLAADGGRDEEGARGRMCAWLAKSKQSCGVLTGGPARTPGMTATLKALSAPALRVTACCGHPRHLPAGRRPEAVLAAAQAALSLCRRLSAQRSRAVVQGWQQRNLIRLAIPNRDCLPPDPATAADSRPGSVRDNHALPGTIVLQSEVRLQASRAAEAASPPVHDGLTAPPAAVPPVQRRVLHHGHGRPVHGTAHVFQYALRPRVFLVATMSHVDLPVRGRVHSSGAHETSTKAIRVLGKYVSEALAPSLHAGTGHAHIEFWHC
ncbi:hypothetical protein OPT61_g9724 [Boeremia exigua]|uniref:Uncharacterized protein n=1 Tax=Boeremia exigua TaxID=749465 RepID=A0ACC2HSU3_9PLEO|nr:hypothetical protein OPT61_g9724 [Boeremia exigua]